MRAKVRRFHQQTAANRTVHVDLQEWREETFGMSRELLRPVLEPNLLSHFIAENALGKSCFVYFAVSLLCFAVSWLYFAVSLLCFAVSWFYFAVRLCVFCREFIFILPGVDCILPWADFILPWVNCILPWADLLLPWVNFILPWADLVLPSVYIVLPWVNFILPWRFIWLQIYFVVPRVEICFAVTFCFTVALVGHRSWE